MNTKPMMKCGHSANAQRVLNDGTRVPACAICAMGHADDQDAYTIVAAPDLTDRRARCSYSAGRDGKPGHPERSEVPSRVELAFFERKPDEPFDRYYCGCWGSN